MRPWLTLHFRGEPETVTCERCRCKVGLVRLGRGQPSVLVDTLAVEVLCGGERSDVAIHDCRRTRAAQALARFPETVLAVLDQAEACEGEGGAP